MKDQDIGVSKELYRLLHDQDFNGGAPKLDAEEAAISESGATMIIGKQENTVTKKAEDKTVKVEEDAIQDDEEKWKVLHEHRVRRQAAYVEEASQAGKHIPANESKFGKYMRKALLEKLKKQYSEDVHERVRKKEEAEKKEEETATVYEG